VRNAEDATAVLRVDVLRNQVAGYQKTGILTTGRVDVRVEDNTVEGGGPVAGIARNGIQVSYGATGQVTGNTVTGNAYTGADTVASGIIVAGGPYFGKPLSRDVVIQSNTLEDNDVGINVSQAAAAGGPLPESTRLQVVENTLRSAALTNRYPYQAGISDYGAGNLISRNRISGVGYDRTTSPGATFDVDVVAGTAAQVVFVTAARRVAAGVCSEELAVQSQDPVGNLSALAAPALVLQAEGTAEVTLCRRCRRRARARSCGWRRRTRGGGVLLPRRAGGHGDAVGGGGWRERVPGADGGVSAGPALVPRRLPREAPASPGASSDRGPVPLGKG